MLLFVLSQKNLALARAEVASLYPMRKIEEQYAFVDKPSNKQSFLRIPLAFTKEIYEILFSSSKKNLFEKIKKYDWNKKIKGSFCVRSVANEREIAGSIWQKIKYPCVDLEHPDTLIHFFFMKKKVYCSRLLWKNDYAFLQRKATQRPGFYPASLDPQLARAMVNLSAAKKNARIVDPFCGTGGILIEATFSGRKVVGYDISSWMLEKCKKNIEHYNLKNVIFAVRDATTFRKKCAAIVTELPFGKNTKSQDLLMLYSQFLENAKRSTNNIVVSFPHFVDYRTICRKTGWKIKQKFVCYIHASLSKDVVVLERKVRKKKAKESSS